MPVIPKFRRQRQQALEFKVIILSYLEFKANLDYNLDPISKNCTISKSNIHSCS